MEVPSLSKVAGGSGRRAKKAGADRFAGRGAGQGPAGGAARGGPESHDRDDHRQGSWYIPDLICPAKSDRGYVGLAIEAARRRCRVRRRSETTRRDRQNHEDGNEDQAFNSCGHFAVGVGAVIGRAHAPSAPSPPRGLVSRPVPPQLRSARFLPGNNSSARSCRRPGEGAALWHL